jgi:hypothetical protein
MSKRTIGMGLVALGVILLIVSLAADSIGIGTGTGIGWKQIAGAVVGAIIAVYGFWSLRSQTSK